jgi:hypothetical protein
MKKYGTAGQDTDDNKYGIGKFHAGQLRIQTYTQNMLYTLLFHGNNGYMDASQCYTYVGLPKNSGEFDHKKVSYRNS